MMSIDPKEISEITKVVSPIVPEAYKDLAAPAMKEFGRIAEDIAKAIHLVCFPLQAAAALQDLVRYYFYQAVQQVPEGQRVVPPDSVMLPIAEKLRFQEEHSPITELYINLLARAMDRERLCEAHPAFITIISQLAPDEAICLEELASHNYTLVIRMDDRWSAPNAKQIGEVFVNYRMSPSLIEQSNAIVFKYERLVQPDLFGVFQEHLQGLGLVEYTNDPGNSGEYQKIKVFQQNLTAKIFFIRLSQFGKLFHKACVSQSPMATTRTTTGR